MAWSALVVLSLVGCAGHVRAVDFSAPMPASVALDTPGPIVHEAVISARWAVPLRGLIDLSDPRASELEPGKHPIVLPVHVPDPPRSGRVRGGQRRARAKTPARGLIRLFGGGIAPVETLADILDRQSAPLAGVLLTHAHMDHVLGLADVPEGVPVYAGQGEEEPANATGRLSPPSAARWVIDRSLSGTSAARA